MPNVFLPAEHTDADLVLASQVAVAVDSAELFVAWSSELGPSAPRIHAVLRRPRHPFADALAKFWRALTSRRARR